MSDGRLVRRGRRPTRPGDPVEVPPPPRKPGDLRYSLGEFLFVVLITGGLLAGITHTAFRLYFMASGIRPGVRFLGLEVGGLGKVPALEKLEERVRSCFRFPLLLELGETVYFLYIRDHFQVEVDYEALYDEARKLDSELEVTERARRFLEADFPVVDLPWRPTLDREYSRPRIAQLIKDRTERHVQAFYQPDGNLRVVISNADDQVEAILEQLEQVIRDNPPPGRRVLKPATMDAAADEYVVAPDDPERGFKAELGRAKVALDPEAPAEALANIQAAMQRIDRMILNPADTFSLAEAAGPFTLEAGYLGLPPPPPEPDLPPTLDPGPAPGTGELPDAPEGPVQVGVGVERLAAAVFQGLIRAGADVKERTVHHHFGPELGYTAPGFDVRLLPEEDGPPGDLVVKNRWDFPLRLRTRLEAGSLTVWVEGLQEPPVGVEIRVGVPEKVPYKTELVRDPSLLRGVERVERQGIDGYRVKIFRKFLRPDGLPSNETMLMDPVDYEPRSSRIVLGTGVRPRWRRRVVGQTPGSEATPQGW